MSYLLVEYKEILDKIEESLGITFHNRELLVNAFIHDSFVYENEGVSLSNERLEFLGDSVLGMVVSHEVFKRYPHWKEGAMTLFKSRVVNTESLGNISRELELGRFLLLGRGEEASGGRDRTSILADVLEALIGAVYLDQGMEEAYRFVLRLFEPHLAGASPLKDYKSNLQEISQRLYKTLPNYSVVEENGPPHQKFFRVKVEISDSVGGLGEGSSKKEAEQNAARDLMGKIELEKDRQKEREREREKEKDF